MNLAAFISEVCALLTFSTLAFAAPYSPLDLEQSLPPDERERMYRDMDRFASSYPGREQLEGRRQRMLRDRFKLADPDNDGSISREEAEQRMPILVKYFDELDSDGDGVLNMEELLAAQGKLREQREARELQARQEAERIVAQPPPARNKPSKKRQKNPPPEAETNEGS